MTTTTETAQATTTTARTATTAHTTATAQATTTDQSNNLHLIPELAPHWQGFDFREILARPAAFVSISQSNSLYRPGGVQYAEGHDKRGSLPATLKVLEAARKAENFISFNWVGYTLFRDDYPQTEFDRAQFDSFTAHRTFTKEEQEWDNALVDELRAQVRPGDNELYERAHQTAFIGTNLPLEFARKRVEVVVFTGIHLDWCIEGNVRNARDNGLLPIVIGDATGAATLEQEKVAFERINNYFAPVITSDQFVQWVS